MQREHVLAHRHTPAPHIWNTKLMLTANETVSYRNDIDCGSFSGFLLCGRGAVAQSRLVHWALPLSCVQFKSIARFLTQYSLILGQEQPTCSMQCKDALLYICFSTRLLFYFIFSLYIKNNKLFLKLLTLPHCVLFNWIICNSINGTTNINVGSILITVHVLVSFEVFA